MKKFTLNACLALVICFVSACENKREGGDNYSTPTEEIGSGEGDEIKTGEDVGMQTPNDTTSIVTGKPGVPLYTTDADFVAMAASGGNLEVELGKVAAKKGSSAEVKKFGQQMVDDHGKANAELKTLAGKKNWVTPAKMLVDHQNTYDRIAKLNGKDFDRDYVAQMVLDHEQTVGMFEQATKQASDTDLKAWTSKTLPTLRMHLDMARQMDMKMNNVK